ncbi:phytanoyl-CoA dioxygenase family protein [Rhodopila sp.]|uniref:phytanoyl-CoA dioxygenase family protein n=1 Tax=Rhodopila sp. TaxID=2480087 RepID=UPI003D0960D0
MNSTGSRPELLRAVIRPFAAPFWAAQLLTGAKSFMDNPMIGSRQLNERGLHVGRVALAHRLAARRRRAIGANVEPADRAAFERDGFVVKRDFLAPALFERLCAQIRVHRGQGREMVQGDTITRRIAIDPATLSRIPAMRDVLAMPEWHWLIRFAWSYNAAPLVYVQTILSHVLSGPEDPQCALHADTFHPTVKAWLFLTDVAEDEGPFTYVPGSHRATTARLDWEKRMSLRAPDAPDRMTRRGSFRVEASELAELGLPPPVALAVPANTLVVADTHGFHARGPSVRPTRRVEIWAYGRRNPFLPWIGLDPWSIGELGHYRVPLYWRGGDLAEGLGMKRNVWRPRDGVSAFDGAVPS